MVSSQRYDITVISKMRLNETHDWSAGIEGYRLFGRDEQDTTGGERFVRERFDYTATAVSEDVVESPCTRNRGMKSKGCVTVSVYCEWPGQV